MLPRTASHLYHSHTQQHTFPQRVFKIHLSIHATINVHPRVTQSHPCHKYEFCFENNIILCKLPSHTSHKTQPCDVSVFGPLKTAYRDEVERRYRGGLTNVNKEHFTAIWSRAREAGITTKNILAGWAKTGLFPFNPSRILRDIVKGIALRHNHHSAHKTVAVRAQL
jgi:hypothetical protein